MKGAECSFHHDRKVGGCTNCGSTGHGKDKCTRPKMQNGGKHKEAEPRAKAEAATVHAQAATTKTDELGPEWVLFDSGATHFLRKLKKGEPMPKKAREVRNKLAVGTVRAWTVGQEVLVPSAAEVSTLVPMGRVIACGCRFEWLPDGAELRTPNGTEIEVRIRNSEPYISQSDVKLLKDLCSDAAGGRPRGRTGKVSLDVEPERASHGTDDEGAWYLDGLEEHRRIAALMEEHRPQSRRHWNWQRNWFATYAILAV